MRAHRSRFASLAPASLALAALVALSPADVRAQTDAEVAAVEPVSSSVRPFFVGGGLGVSIGLDGGPALFQLEETVGYRFFSTDLGSSMDLHLFGALALSQHVGDLTFLTFTGRFGADLEVYDGGSIAVLITPAIALGGAVSIVNVPNGFGGSSTVTNGAFDFQFITQGEIVLADGLVGIYLRPIAIDVFASSATTSRWEITAGANVRL